MIDMDEDTDPPNVVTATARDVAQLAALHAECLPASLISMLGPAAVERYYAFATASPLERVLVVRGGDNPTGAMHMDFDGEITHGEPTTGGSITASVAATQGIVAGCVLSLEPATLLRRFARGTPAHLAADIVRAALPNRDFRYRLRSRLREAIRPLSRFLEPTGDEAPLPEVTQIFTDPDQRGQGHGAALLHACETLLRDLGHTGYCVHTLVEDNDAGIRFYRREGFVVTGTSRSFGDDYLVMEKGLA